MKGSDKAVLLGVLIALLLGVFYLKVLSPKRSEATSLKKDIAGLQGQIDTKQQEADAGEAARKNYPVYYARLVTMGKAAPAAADTSSLLVDLNHTAKSSKVTFDSLQLDASSGATSTATPPSTGSGSTGGTSSTGTATTGGSSTGTTTTPSGSGSDSSAGGSAAPASSTTTTPTAAATETAAASLPIGASVGPASLPVMPYDLKFRGGFFDTANFLTGIDDFVNVNNGLTVATDGRLLTVDGFALSKPTLGPSPTMEVDLAVTSYVTPPDQGLTAGATPSGPAASTVQTQPVSATVSP